MDAVRRLVQRPGVRGSLVALLVYTLATLVMTYPVPFRLGAVIAGFPARDGWQYTWWLWFARRALLEGRGLGDLYLMNHPLGLQHPYQWSLTYLSLMALPLESLFSPAATFNLMVLASFVLSGLAAYHLCRALTEDHWAAVVGGAIFAFAPNRLGHAMAGWLPQMTVYLYPWYALLLWRSLRRPRPSVRRSIGLGVLAGVAATVYVMHIAYVMLPLTLVIVGAELLRRRRSFFEGRRIRHLGLALLVAWLIALPPLLPLIVGRFREGLDYLSTKGVVGHSTDLLAFFTPSPYHPLLAPLGLVPAFARRVFKDPEALRAALAYPGLAAVLLALWGALRARRRPWRWIVLAVGAALFSLGPILVVGGEPVIYAADGYRAHVLLPYALVRRIPLLDWGRTPGRLNAVGMLGVGVLASYGMADLLSRLGRARWQAGISLLAVVFVLFEFLPLWPFPAGEATIPPVIQRIADRPGDGALLHLPLDRRRVNHRALFFQTALPRPIVGGEVLRMLPATPPWWRSIEGLVVDGGPDAVPRPDEARRLGWLRHFGVDWVLLHRLEEGDEAHYRPLIEQLLGAAVAEDETLAAFRVPDVESSLGREEEDSPLLYTFSPHGWHEPEQDGGIWRRWLYEDGELYLYAAGEESGVLRFTVDSHLGFPALEIYREGGLLDTFVVDGRTTYATRPFTLTSGMTVFRFHAPGGCPQGLDDPRCWGDALLESPPEGARPPCDAPTTCRTFVFDHVSFVPAGDRASGEAFGPGIDFGNQVRLRGWDVDPTTVAPGERLTVTLTWEALAPLSDRHVIFAHLLSSGGELVSQRDAPPVGEVVPPAAWPEGAIFGYPMTLDLPDDLLAGEYRLLVGVYLWPSLERLPVPQSETGAIELEKVTVVP